MTPPAIVMKLNAILANPIDSECKVVYVLCEVRKLLERVPANRRPFALNMYCHWAMHIDLHGKDTVRPFLEQIDRYIEGYLGEAGEDLSTSHQMVREFALFDTFRAQLAEFFRMNGITTALTDDDDRWSQFLTHYAGVIEDGSLSIRAQSHGLKFVKEVTFEKGRDAVGEFTQIPFAMVWSVSLLDGRGFDIDVSSMRAQEGGLPMIGWGVHLR